MCIPPKTIGCFIVSSDSGIYMCTNKNIAKFHQELIITSLSYNGNVEINETDDYWIVDDKVEKIEIILVRCNYDN